MAHLDPAPALAWLRARSATEPRLGIVLGSGFGDVLERVPGLACFPFAEIPGFLAPSVPGHAGTLALGHLEGLPVVLLAGRLHLYEGHDPATVTFPIRVLAALGIRDLLLTNAAGGIRADLEPGQLVALTDHLNLTGVSPLRGCAAGTGFVDLSEVYSPVLRGLLHAAAGASSVSLTEGVYAGVMGPSYETPAEIRALRGLGADLVGMSTVAEAVVARQCGLQVAAVSCITNRAAGLGGRISHEEVLATGRAVRPAVFRLLSGFARRLSEVPPSSSRP